MRSVIFFFLLISSILLPLSAYSDTYWVSPTGTSLWNSARSKLVLSGTSCASLKTANDSAKAGDTIILRGGNYNTSLTPAKSGTGVTDMIVFQAHKNEKPLISGNTKYGTFVGISISDRHYIKIDGITVRDADRWMNVQAGSSHIEITNCEFSESDGKCVRGIVIWGQCNGGSSFNCPVSNIWFHHNKIHDDGWVNPNGNDEGALMNVGSSTEGDSNSNYNTIENNVFYHGGHHLLETYTKFNIIRGNLFHNEGFMSPPEGVTLPNAPGANGLYGNRCIQIYDGHNQDGLFNLIENNRFTATGCPPDDGGGNAFKLVSRKNIARHNYISNSQGDGIYFKRGYLAYSDSNIVYNNTIYKTGLAPLSRTDFRRNGISIHGNSMGNIIKNNLIYDYKKNAIFLIGAGSLSNSTIEGNWTWDDGDPMFYNTDVSNPYSDTLPNLKLRPGSPCIARGVHLTIATNSGTNSTTLKVENALYFQDGTWGSSLADLNADWISVGSAANRSQILSIDYKSNTITLIKPISWSVNAKIWLFKDSASRVTLTGNAPEIGANETYNN